MHYLEIFSSIKSSYMCSEPIVFMFSDSSWCLLALICVFAFKETNLDFFKLIKEQNMFFGVMEITTKINKHI